MRDTSRVFSIDYPEDICKNRPERAQLKAHETSSLLLRKLFNDH